MSAVRRRFREGRWCPGEAGPGPRGHGRLAPAPLAALAALAVAAACARPVAVGGPRLTARWTGSDTSAFSAPVVGEWCAPLRLLQIRAVIGDTGLALAT
jgi:hypothetical protein